MKEAYESLEAIAEATLAFLTANLPKCTIIQLHLTGSGNVLAIPKCAEVVIV